MTTNLGLNCFSYAHKFCYACKFRDNFFNIKILGLNFSKYNSMNTVPFNYCKTMTIEKFDL